MFACYIRLLSALSTCCPVMPCHRSNHRVEEVKNEEEEKEDEEMVTSPPHCLCDTGGTSYDSVGSQPASLPLVHVPSFDSVGCLPASLPTVHVHDACDGTVHLACPAARAAKDDKEKVVCSSDIWDIYGSDWVDIDNAGKAFHEVWVCLDELDYMLGELGFKCSEQLFPMSHSIVSKSVGPITLSLADLIPAPSSNEIPANDVRDDCAMVIAKRESFVHGMREFICKAYCQCEDLVDEPYMSAGFFESCFCVHFMILEDLASFSEPTFIREVIEFECYDT